MPRELELFLLVGIVLEPKKFIEANSKIPNLSKIHVYTYSGANVLIFPRGDIFVILRITTLEIRI